MKTSEVPQDIRNFREGEKLKKLMYATDHNGHYVGTVSAGWEPENLATKQAWEAVEERLLATKAAVKQGHLSPLAYYMEQHLMDIALLAKYARKWQWQVKRHLKPNGFKQLSEKSLKTYAEVFNITVEALLHPDLK